MRVALNLSQAVGRFGGGTGTFVDGLLDGLARVAGDVDFLILQSPEAAEAGVWPVPNAHWRLRVVTDPAATGFGFAQIGDPAVKALGALVRDQRIDVWFTPNTLPAPPILPCATVVAMLDVQQEDRPGYYDARELARRALVYETIARTATRVLTISEFSRQRIRERFGIDDDRLDVMTLAPPPWASAPLDAATPLPFVLPDRYVFYPATTWSHKNHGTLVDALRRCRDAGLDLHLVCTGLDGDARPGVLDTVDRQGMVDRVHWLGYVDARWMRQLYARAAMLVVPSLYEGFGLPLVEAMACRCPIVASDAAGLPETAGEAALLVDARQPAVIAEAIRRVAGDPALRAKLVSAGRNRLAAFTWERGARQALACFRRAAAEGPRAVPLPRHVTPERSFSAPCRYYVHTPEAATLSVSAVAAEAGAWTLRVVGGGLDDTRRAHGHRLVESIEVPGPTGLEVVCAFDGAPGTVLPRVEHLTLAGAGRVLDLLPALEAGGASASESFEEGLARAVLMVRGLGAMGVRRLALYGAGRHTCHLIAQLAGGTPVVAGVVDDDAAPGATCEGLRLVRPDAFAALNAEALVLSSRAFEPALAARAARWLPPGVRLVRLYTVQGPEPEASSPEP